MATAANEKAQQLGPEKFDHTVLMAITDEFQAVEAQKALFKKKREKNERFSQAEVDAFRVARDSFRTTVLVGFRQSMSDENFSLATEVVIQGQRVLDLLKSTLPEETVVAAPAAASVPRPAPPPRESRPRADRTFHVLPGDSGDAASQGQESPFYTAPFTDYSQPWVARPEPDVIDRKALASREAPFYNDVGRLMVDPSWNTRQGRNRFPDRENPGREINQPVFDFDGKIARSAQIPFDLDVAGKTSAAEREVNEDYLSCRKMVLADGTELVVARVFDGMGGMGDGDKFAEIAAKKEIEFLHSLSESDLTDIRAGASRSYLSFGEVLMKHVLAKLNFSMIDWNRRQGKNAGATITGGYIIGKEFVIGNIGDARTTILDGNGTLYYESTDQSQPWKAARRGEISREQAARHPQNNLVYKSISQPGVDIVHEREAGKQDDHQIAVRQLESGQTIVMTCDGISGVMDGSAGARAITMSRVVDRVRNANASIVSNEIFAQGKGSKDNETSLVIRVK